MENNSFQSSAAGNNNSNINSNNTTAAAAPPPPPQNSHFQNSLRSLNKSSYKISKPPARNPTPNPNPNPNPSNPSNPSPNPPPSNPNPSPQSQPPVYNIDKSDFREIVQKLTGSPAHRHPPAPSSPSPSSAPPPPPPATTSRLHRIRPPPLSNLSHVVGPPPAEVWARPALSPLPPLPTVSAASESPITAYMRRLRGGPSPTAGAGAPPLSPLGFGCYGMMLSPSLLMPTSPRMPLPSPRFSTEHIESVMLSYWPSRLFDDSFPKLPSSSFHGILGTESLNYARSPDLERFYSSPSLSINSVSECRNFCRHGT